MRKAAVTLKYKSKIKKSKFVTILGFSLAAWLLLVQSSFASGVVIDFKTEASTAATAATVVKQLKELRKEYTEIQDQYNMLQSQYNVMKQQYAAMTGNYGWGNWENSASDLVNREWTAQSWQAALMGEAGGNAERYKELLNEYQQNHPTLSKNNFAAGTDPDLAVTYHHEVQTNQTSATMASDEFAQINQHLQTLQKLGQQIESSQNSNTKSATDLNSRIQLQVGFIAVSELRMQALLNEQMAQLQAHKIALETEAAKYNQAGAQP